MESKKEETKRLNKEIKKRVRSHNNQVQSTSQIPKQNTLEEQAKTLSISNSSDDTNLEESIKALKNEQKAFAKRLHALESKFIKNESLLDKKSSHRKKMHQEHRELLSEEKSLQKEFKELSKRSMELKNRAKNLEIDTESNLAKALGNLDLYEELGGIEAIQTTFKEVTQKVKGLSEERDKTYLKEVEQLTVVKSKSRESVSNEEIISKDKKKKALISVLENTYLPLYLFEIFCYLNIYDKDPDKCLTYQLKSYNFARLVLDSVKDDKFEFDNKISQWEKNVKSGKAGVHYETTRKFKQGMSDDDLEKYLEEYVYHSIIHAANSSGIVLPNIDYSSLPKITNVDQVILDLKKRPSAKRKT